MKGRIRTIKPEIALDEDLWNLCKEMPGAPVFQVYAMLWCHADREERFEWRPQALRVLCSPYWDGDFSGLLDAFERIGFIQRYEVDGKQYGLVRNLKRHQAFNSREPESKLPPPQTPLVHAYARMSSPLAHAQEERERNGNGNGNGTEREVEMEVELEAPEREVVSGPTSRVEVRSERTRPDNPKLAPLASETTSALSTVASAPPRGAQEQQQPLLRSRSAVMELPINERARWYLANQHQFFGGASDWAQPETWPEVLEPIKAFHSAGNLRSPRLQGYNRDYAVKNVIGHYAAGYSCDELVSAYKGVVASDYYLKRVTAGQRPHASWVTAGVLQCQLQDSPDNSAPIELARRQVEREKTAKAARLVAEVEHTQSLATKEDDDWDMPTTTQLVTGSSPRALVGGDR